MIDKIEVPKEKLEALIKQNNDYEKDIKTMYAAVIGILEVIGLAENGKINPDAFGPGSDPMPELLKGGSKIMGLILKAGVPIIGKAAETELKEKFAFFAPLMPLIEKYKYINN